MSLAVHDERLTVRVGAVTLLLVAGAVVALVTLGRFSLRDSFAATVYYEYAGALREGADVQVAGRVIGKVTGIALVPIHQAAAPEHPLHGTGGVAVTIRLERRYADMAPVNGEYFLSAKGIIGDSFVEIGPPVDDAPRGRPLRAGEAVRGVDAPRIDRSLLDSYDSVKTSQGLLAGLAPEARRLGRSLNELADALDGLLPPEARPADAPFPALVAEIRATARAWDQAGLRWQDITGVAGRARQTVAHIDAAVTEVRGRVQTLREAFARLGVHVPEDMRARLEQALARAEASLARIDHIIEGVQTLMAYLERGQGTIGALLNDPEFSDDAKSLGKMLKRQPWRLIGPPPRE